MTEKINFNQDVKRFLNQLYDDIDEMVGERDIEVDLLDDVLSILLPGQRQYIINKHSPTQQIWVSSPASGASYYRFDQGTNSWINKKDEELAKKIKHEIFDFLSKQSEE